MKKNTVVISVIFFWFLADSVLANASSNLKNRLDKIDSFYSIFTQKVMDADYNIVQFGQGDLWMKRPNLFHWHTTQPDESVLVSDGKTLWFYSPILEQVTAMWLKDVIKITPFMLITCNKMEDWKKYDIQQNGNSFVLTPKNINGNNNLKRFSINISPDGVIHRFTIIEEDNQSNNYDLKFKKKNSIQVSKFTFIMPKGVTIDDQRN